jgi:kynurenine formamidase
MVRGDEMIRWIDLSGPLFNGMWSYNLLGGLPRPQAEYRVEKDFSIAEVGFESFKYTVGSLSGTYLETAGHLIEGAPTLTDFALTDFMRPAVVCRLPRKGAREFIRRAELEAHCPPVRQGDALLIECGWATQQWRSHRFMTDGPAFHPDCRPWLIEQPFSILGVDIPCIQAPYPVPDGSSYDGNILLPIFQKGILLLAPLMNLDQVRAERGELIALPMRAEGVSGAPCRAVFREET